MTQSNVELAEDWSLPVSGVEPPRLRGHRWGTRRLSPGQDLYGARERTARLFVVADGLFMSKSNRAEVAELLGPGDVVNPTGVTSSEAWAAADGATVTALSHAKVRSVTLTTLHSVMARNPALCMWLATSVAHRIRRVETQRLIRLDARAGDAVSLVAWILLRLSSCLGSDRLGGGTGHALSQSVLADLIGMTRETVNRSLGLMRRRGWIALLDEGVIILDRRALEGRARHALRIGPVPCASGSLAGADRSPEAARVAPTAQ